MYSPLASRAPVLRRCDRSQRSNASQRNGKSGVYPAKNSRVPSVEPSSSTSSSKSRNVCASTKASARLRYSIRLKVGMITLTWGSGFGARGSGLGIFKFGIARLSTRRQTVRDGQFLLLLCAAIHLEVAWNKLKKRRN